MFSFTKYTKLLWDHNYTYLSYFWYKIKVYENFVLKVPMHQCNQHPIFRKLGYFGMWTTVSYLLLTVYHAMAFILKHNSGLFIDKSMYLQQHLHVQHMQYEAIFFLPIYNISQMLAYTKGVPHWERYTYPEISTNNFTPTIKSLSNISQIGTFWDVNYCELFTIDSLPCFGIYFEAQLRAIHS